MATTVARLEAILSADTGKFDRALTRSQTRMQKAGKAAGLMTAAVGGVLVAGLAKSVKEAIQAEKSQARLEQSFKRNVKGGIEPYRDALEEAGKKARDLGFDDEDLADSIGSLLVPTQDYGKAQEAANVAMDLARFKGVSLESATKILTATMAGNVRAAKQLGIDVPKVTTSYDNLKAKFTDASSEGGKTITMTEKLALKTAILEDKQRTAAKVIETVGDKVKGQAKAYADTTEGGMKVFREQVEELQEQLGTKLLPAINNIVEKLTELLQFFEDHPKLGRAVMYGLAAAITAAFAAQVALNLAVLANPYVAAAVVVIALAAGVYLLSQRLGLAKTAVIVLTAFLSPLAGAFLLAYQLSGKFSDIVNTLWGKLKDLAGWVSANKSFLVPFIGQFDSLRSVLGKIVGAVKWLIEHIPKIPKLPSVPGWVPGLGGGGGAPSTSSHGLIPMVTNAVSAAREMGWSGQVTSGFRTYEEQAALYARYLAGGPLAAKPGTSSHEKGQAVDVTDYGTFGRMMNRLPVGLRLYNKLGARDPVHFSVTGYAKGGIVPGPIGMPQLAMVHGGETITPPGGDINLYVDGQKLFTWFRGAEAKHQRRNG